MFTFVIADDEPHQRKGLASYINWESLGFALRGCFADGGELIEYLRANEVDVVFTDINMSPVSGMDVAAYVHKNRPETTVVFISGHKEFSYAQKALEYHVHGYILKPAQLEEVCRVFQDLAEALAAKKETASAAVPQSGLRPLPEPLGPVSDVIVQKARQYIDAHYAGDVSLDEVADTVHLNPIYFSRFWKQKTGENFISYLVNLRMQKAMELLRSGEHKVYEVSELVGYQSPKYFSRIFKQYTGYSPADYAKLSDGLVE